MNCKQCGNNVSDESAFCNHCGHKLEKSVKNVEKAEIDKIKQDTNETIVGKSLLKNKKVVMFLVIAVIAIISVVGYSIMFSPLKKVVNAIDSKQFDRAEEIFERQIKGVEKSEKEIKTYILEKIEEIANDYEENRIDYGTAESSIKEILNLSFVKYGSPQIQSRIKKLNESRIGYITAVEYDNDGNIIEAIENYSKVIESDRDNYRKSQERIEELKLSYKDEILILLETYKKSNDYEKALILINDSLKVIPKDNDISAKRNIFVEIEKKSKETALKNEMREAEKNQKIKVVSTRIFVQHDQWKSLYPDMFQVIINNKSGKTIKSFKVSMLGWDNNGYPLKIQAGLFGSLMYEYQGYADNVNVLNNEEFGADSGWDLEEKHGIVKTRAVVVEAEFYDGSTWVNPYYKYFLEMYEGKTYNN